MVFLPSLFLKSISALLVVVGFEGGKQNQIKSQLARCNWTKSRLGFILIWKTFGSALSCEPFQSSKTIL